MKEILEALNCEPGITGSMVITGDGILVSAALGPQLEEERVAAIVSLLLVNLRRALSRTGAPGGALSCSLNADRGKIIFFDMGNAFLVVVADPEMKFERAVGPVRGAIQKIKNRRVA